MELTLIDLADNESRHVLLVVEGDHGRSRSGAHILYATLTVRAGAFGGSLHLDLTMQDIDDWVHILDHLERGRPATWPARYAPTITFRFDDNGCPQVAIVDTAQSHAILIVSIAAPHDWVATHRRRLEAIRTSLRS